MARVKRRANTATLDAKIEQQKAALEKAKAKYEAEKETLAELIKLRNEMRKEELMEAVIKSDHSYAEIMTFIKSAGTQGK
jgi:multidrug resistance efflux pump